MRHDLTGLKMGRVLEAVVKNIYGYDVPITHMYTDYELANEEQRYEWVVEQQRVGKDLRPMWVAFQNAADEFAPIPCTLHEGMMVAKKRSGGVFLYRVRNLRTKAAILADVL